MFHGSIVAIVTPMDEQGYIDKASLADLIEMHIEAGTDGIVVMGTTGEAPTLTEAEQNDLINFTVKKVAGRVPVIAGTGTNSTAKTIKQTKEAMSLGVDGCLVVVPYYNKPTQEGMYQHFKAVADQAPLPIMMYNIPGRTGADMRAETVARLANIPNIVAIKEATGQVSRVKEIIELTGSKIDVLSGDDGPAIDMMMVGAKGVVSVTANIAPKLMHEICIAALKGDEQTARSLNESLLGLHQKLFVETNPIPVKWALYKMGRIRAGIRLPLTWLSESAQPEVETALKSAGLI